ncbi:MAG TPA: hypothetical protein VGH20_11700 [Myxococcales bacterium]|jgi:hypothetical protein
MNKPILLFVLLVACAQNTVRREKPIPAPVVLANKACPARSAGAVTAEVNGKRMTCQRQTETGSYLGQCVCWDAAYAEQQRLQAQGIQRQGMPIDACGGSASCLMQGQVGGRGH